MFAWHWGYVMEKTDIVPSIELSVWQGKET